VTGNFDIRGIKEAIHKRLVLKNLSKDSRYTPNLKVWGSIASTLRQQAKPLDRTAALVYSMPGL
jgi:hypothetical protein